MAKKTLKALVPIDDGKRREPGTVFQIDEEHAQALINVGAAEEVQPATKQEDKK